MKILDSKLYVYPGQTKDNVILLGNKILLLWYLSDLPIYVIAVEISNEDWSHLTVKKVEIERERQKLDFGLRIYLYNGDPTSRYHSIRCCLGSGSVEFPAEVLKTLSYDTVECIIHQNDKEIASVKYTVSLE